jgi:hypothetical protein
VSFEAFLIVGAVLFCIGLYGSLIGALALVRPQAGPTGPSAGGPGSSSVPLPPGEV